jgi:SAM-dependent methyltransferase
MPDAREMWSAGDLDAATRMIAEAGPVLIERAAIEPGTRVLDVGAGSGLAVAVPAALLGAHVVASDLTDAWFDLGRSRAAQAGVDLDWVEADVEDLPFADAEFDRVLSSFGHMFAPHHDRAAAEMARVLAPGGILAAAVWEPDAFASALLRLLVRHGAPPPPGAQPPPAWGDPAHARAAFEPHGIELDVSRHTLRMWEGGLDELVTFYEECFGPVLMLKAALGEGWAPVREELADLCAQWTESRPGGTVTLDGDYMVMVGRRDG